LPQPKKENFAMSTKFVQLLDYLVNEEHEKAKELFHDICVEKSRGIYENLISEEEEMDESKEEEEMDESKEEEEEMDESKEEEMDESAEDEEMDESAEDEEMDESMEDEQVEDSYMMDDEDDVEADKHDFEPGDATDDLGADVMGGDEEDHEADEDHAMMDIKNAIQELEAAFAELEQAQSSEEHDMGLDHDHDSEFDDEETDEELMSMQEARRMTREYVEKVGNDWDKGSTQKAQGKEAGAGTGEKMSAPVEVKSPVSSGKGKPTTGADAKNIAQGDKGDGQHNTGTKPNKVNKGITPEKSEQFTGKDWENNSAPGGKAGVKNLKKQTGWPQNNKTPGPVGSGTGDKAGQTSVSSSKPFLKKL
jgi:hypothetical protein